MATAPGQMAGAAWSNERHQTGKIPQTAVRPSCKPLSYRKPCKDLAFTHPRELLCTMPPAIALQIARKPRSIRTSIFACRKKNPIPYYARNYVSAQLEKFEAWGEPRCGGSLGRLRISAGANLVLVRCQQRSGGYNSPPAPTPFWCRWGRAHHLVPPRLDSTSPTPLLRCLLAYLSLLSALAM